MKVPTVTLYEFPPKAYLLLDEGQGNDVLMEAYMIKPVEVEVVIDPEDGGEPRTERETRYKLFRRTFEETEIEPLKTKDEAMRKATSELILEWASRTP